MKNCVIVVNTDKSDAPALGEKISVFLAQHEVHSRICLFPNSVLDNPFTGSDFVVTLGGDGTVLFAARSAAPLRIPVFPVNLGTFGFLAGIAADDWESKLALFLAGRLDFEEHALARCTVKRAGNCLYTTDALNDIVVSRKTPEAVITLDVASGGISLGRFRLDSIIVATATGSTAYSASAGGPIIAPTLDVIELTPVNSISLSNRPLVLPAQNALSIELVDTRSPPAQVLADGCGLCDINIGDEVCVQKADYRVRLLGSTSASFYSALRSKMNWAGGFPVA
jgi:NAD+ kinase